MYSWGEFLIRWSADLLASANAAEWNLPPESIDSGWVGFPAASADQIAAADARLGVVLPPSYREFLMVSNGWPVMGNPFSGGLLPVEQIDRFGVRNPEWLNIIRGLPDLAGVDFVYPVSDEAFENAIEICDTREGTLMLNPQVIDASGEMEAWFFEAEMGVQRYPSFWALMQAEYRMFQAVEENNQ